MSERLVRERSHGLNTTGMRIWGMVFLILASAGTALLQNRLLKMTGGTSLLDALNAEGGMVIATLALILQAVEGLAIPVFCFLLVEGAVHTGNLNAYLLRVVENADDNIYNPCYDITVQNRCKILRTIYNSNRAILVM